MPAFSADSRSSRAFLSRLANEYQWLTKWRNDKSVLLYIFVGVWGTPWLASEMVIRACQCACHSRDVFARNAFFFYTKEFFAQGWTKLKEIPHGR